MWYRPFMSSGKALIKRLAKEKDRKKVSLYLSEGLYEDFKRQCKKNGLAASAVMEELMREFLSSVKK